MPGAVSSEELAGWRAEESWGDRSREAGSGAGCPDGRASRQPRGEAGECPLHVRWQQMEDRNRRQAAGPQAWGHTDLSLPSVLWEDFSYKISLLRAFTGSFYQQPGCQCPTTGVH